MTMTVLMENTKKNSSGERSQHLFNKNIELEKKRRKAAQARIPSDPNTWQQMCENYEAIILEDRVFSEQHDIEYALWQLHYRRIEELRALLNAAVASAGSATPLNGKGPVRSGPDRVAKIRSQFKTFLSESTGFYHDFMLKIRAKSGLPLGYFSDDSDNHIPMSKDGNKSSDVKKGLISCHRCLIYLGDLARYKGLYGEGDSKARDFAAASSYYMQASSLCPSSGNPHHQLAILAGYSNDELVSIYRYFRSLAVENPFTTARDNLIIAFEKNRQNYTQLIGDCKSTKVKVTPPRTRGKGRGMNGRPPSKDNKVEPHAVEKIATTNFELFKAFTIRFIRLNGILFTRTSLEMFAEVLSAVKTGLLELLSSGPVEDCTLGSDAAEFRLAVLRIIAILIYTVHNVNKESENQSYAEILQRSVLLQNAFTATFELMGCVVVRCNDLDDPSSSYLLPGIMVFLEWLACHPDVAVGSELEEKQVNARSFFWNKCVSLLNKLLSNGSVFVYEHEEETCFLNMSKYYETETSNRLALSEDIELRGFLPLVPAQLILDFSRKHGGDGGNKENIARVQRIIAAGKAVANFIRIGQDGVYFDTKLKKFVIGTEPQIDDSLLVSPLESSLNSSSLDSSVGAQIAVDSVPKPQRGPEDENDDEDEVILFKPSTIEKHMDEFSSKLTSAELLHSVGVGKSDVLKENGSFLLGHDGFMQNASKACIIPSTSSGTATSQYLPLQPRTSNRPLEPAPIANGLAHLNLIDNGSLGSELQNQFGVSQPAAVSVPHPQFVSSCAAYKYPSQISQAMVPSKFDSIMFSAASVDELPETQSSLMPTGLKKNPVGRAARHLGPPPGFGSFPSKIADESLNMSVKHDSPLVPQMDDYSSLDEYPKIRLSKPSGGFCSYIDQVQPSFNSMSKNNCSMGIASFPFPGKLVSALQVQGEHQKVRQDIPDQMKMYAEQQQQQQFKKGYQQPVGPPQQYQGQSVWEGRFFV